MAKKVKKSQAEFIKFLRESHIVRFGSFKLKSGRISPVFIDGKDLYKGKQLSKLGQFYAKAIYARFGGSIDVICGIAYKGMPLVIATATALYRNYGISVDTCIYGGVDYEGANVFRGTKPKEGSRIVIIDDVIVSGGTIETVVKAIREQVLNPMIRGMLVAVDRQEVGTDRTITAVQEVSRRNIMPVEGIVTMDQVLSVLREEKDTGLSDDINRAIEEYRQKYSPVEQDDEHWNPA
ncbi:MAG: hypothetical protein K6G36_01590 [Candidatus Saccharibacteria bacterium]|nr:hypothetical protein [Candidatus Saccharibacteria bacterium]